MPKTGKRWFEALVLAFVSISVLCVLVWSALPPQTNSAALTALTSWCDKINHTLGHYESSTFETCQLCGSNKQIGPGFRIGPLIVSKQTRFPYESSRFATCKHRWESGVSKAVDQVIPDGNVVLVRLANSYGAFILTNQTMHPKCTEFRWYLRSDGEALLDPKDTAVTNGLGSSSESDLTPAIQFGPIDVEWSAAGAGGSWIYYKHYPGEAIRTDSLRICVTELHSVNMLDASDPKWFYKASPTDTGR